MKNKIAIKVNNKREFECVKDYLINKKISWGDNKDFDASILEFEPDEFGFEYFVLGDKNGIYRLDGGNYKSSDGELISFNAFAQIAGIEVKNEVVIGLGKFETAVVKQDGVYIKDGSGVLYIDENILEEIYTSYKSLQ